MDSPSPPDHLSRSVDRSRTVACRECRRSKIRCSRVFPCQACTRRGCQDICPDGIKETRRSKTDETLLQENARLVRRIRHLEGILLSLKHPAGLPSSPDDMFLSPASPGQDSQSSEIPSDDFPDPMLSDALASVHDPDTSSDPLFNGPARVLAENHENSIPQLDRGSMQALETQLTRNKALLAPGCQFILQTLLDLCRTCEVFPVGGSSTSENIGPRPVGGHSSSDEHVLLDTTTLASSGRQSLLSSPVPASSPSSRETPSETLPSGTNIGFSTEDLSSNVTDEVIWDFTNMIPAIPSSAGEEVQTAIPDQFGETPFQTGCSDDGQSNEPMGAQLCQELLAELGWRHS